MLYTNYLHYQKTMPLPILATLSLLAPLALSGGEMPTSLLSAPKTEANQVEQRGTEAKQNDSLTFTLNKKSATLTNAIHLQSAERMQWTSAACGCASCANLAA